MGEKLKVDLSESAATESEVVKPAIAVDVSGEHFHYAARFMAAGDVRYYLNGLYIAPNPKGSGAIIAGCDGHTLCAYLDEDGSCSEPVIIECSKPFIAATKKDGARVSLVDGLLSVKSRFGMPLYIHPGKAIIEGKYPDIQKPIPAELEPGFPGAYNSRYLLRLIGGGNNKYDCGHFWHDAKNKETGALLYRPDFLKNGFAIVMGMRVDRPSMLPDWAEPQSAA